MSDPANNLSTPTDRRGQLVCLMGLVIQSVLFAAVLAMGLWGDYGSDAVVAAALHLAGAVPIWAILLIVFTQRQRSAVENLETQQLHKSQEAGLATNIFDVGDESMLLQRRRLNWTYKFLFPAFTVFIAVYHLVVGGGFLFGAWRIEQSLDLQWEWARTDVPFAVMVFMGGAAVFSFAFARYVIGMARQAEWQLLRAGGSYLLGNALTTTVVLVAMALAQIETTRLWAEPVAAYVIRIAVLLLGIEVLFYFIWDFYRPRRAEEGIRPAFDSRLLALFSEPGGIVRSIAGTINYQFGFEVSSTWFYKLIQRSVFPLVMLTVLVLILLSAVVIVDVDEQAYIEHFGRVVQGKSEPLGAGFHLKWPWPIDRVVREQVDVIRTLLVGGDLGGADPHDQLAEEEDEATQAILWGDEHGSNTEMLMVVANPQASGLTLETTSNPAADSSRRSRSVAVSLLMISMQIDYRIKDLHNFRYRYRDPEKVLKTIAYQELSNYTASVSITELMGHGRRDFGRRMREQLQRRCDEELQLGIEITFVSLQEAHPPSQSDVAATFQNVVAAEIRKAAAIENARGQADRILTLTAGSVERAKQLDAAIRKLDALSAEAAGVTTSETDETSDHIDDLLFGNKSKGTASATGEVAAEIAGARAYRSLAVSAAESKVRSFRNDLVAYQAAPRLYKMRRYLQLLREKLPPLRKFVFTTEYDKAGLIIEYETERRATLDLETVETP